MGQLDAIFTERPTRSLFPLAGVLLLGAEGRSPSVFLASTPQGSLGERVSVQSGNTALLLYFFFSSVSVVVHRAALPLAVSNAYTHCTLTEGREIPE